MLGIVIPDVVLSRTSNEPDLPGQVTLLCQEMLCSEMRKATIWWRLDSGNWFRSRVYGNNVKLLHWREPRSLKTEIWRQGRRNLPSAHASLGISLLLKLSMFLLGNCILKSKTAAFFFRLSFTFFSATPFSMPRFEPCVLHRIFQNIKFYLFGSSYGEWSRLVDK